MDLTVIENLLKEFKDIQMSPIKNVLDILNKRIGVDVYYLCNNTIFLKGHIDEEVMNKQGFVSDFSVYHPFVESFYPLKISHKYVYKNNVTIVPNDIAIPKSISIESKKQFLKDYFNNLKTNSRGTLTSLTHRKKTIQKDIDDINNNKQEYISNYFRYNCFIAEEEFINKGFIIVELPIFPTNKIHLVAIKRDNVNSLRYAHDIMELNDEDCIDDIKSIHGDFIVSLNTASEYNLTPLDTIDVLESFPNIYDYITKKNILEEEIANIEKEIVFIKDLKNEENFIKLIKFIEYNTN